jgi:hypothetical protein
MLRNGRLAENRVGNRPTNPRVSGQLSLQDVTHKFPFFPPFVPPESMDVGHSPSRQRFLPGTLPADERPRCASFRI